MAVTADVIRRWHGTHEDHIRVCLHPPYLLGRFAQHPRFPHAYRDEDAPTMIRHAEEMREFADRWGVLIHTHAFRGSLAWATQALGSHLWEILREDVLLAHANGLSMEEVAVAAQADCAVVWVPTTDENIEYGVCPVIDLLAAGVRVAIATDGSAPYMSLSLWKEIPRAAFFQRIARKDRAALPIGKALRMVTIEAARAIGWDNLIGSLEPGKKADVITIDLAQPHLTPHTHIPQLLGYYAEGADVANVIVDGRVVMRDRVVRTVDARSVLAEAEAEAQAALARVDVSNYLAMPRSFWRDPIYSIKESG
jgi:cytosine/adenosine deaminase-related metal-dependent hydrolase